MAANQPATIAAQTAKRRTPSGMRSVRSISTTTRATSSHCGRASRRRDTSIGLPDGTTGDLVSRRQSSRTAAPRPNRQPVADHDVEHLPTATALWPCEDHRPLCERSAPLGRPMSGRSARAQIDGAPRVREPSVPRGRRRYVSCALSAPSRPALRSTLAAAPLIGAAPSAVSISAGPSTPRGGHTGPRGAGPERWVAPAAAGR